VGALVFLLVAGGIAAALPSLRRALAGSPWAASIQPEFLALFVAALAGVWLIPGVEDKVLQGLGLRKRPRKHRRRQRTRSTEVPEDDTVSPG